MSKILKNTNNDDNLLTEEYNYDDEDEMILCEDWAIDESEEQIPSKEDNLGKNVENKENKKMEIIEISDDNDIIEEKKPKKDKKKKDKKESKFFDETLVIFDYEKVLSYVGSDITTIFQSQTMKRIKTSIETYSEIVIPDTEIKKVGYEINFILYLLIYYEDMIVYLKPNSNESMEYLSSIYMIREGFREDFKPIVNTFTNEEDKENYLPSYLGLKTVQMMKTKLFQILNEKGWKKEKDRYIKYSKKNKKQPKYLIDLMTTGYDIADRMTIEYRLMSHSEGITSRFIGKEMVLNLFRREMTDKGKVMFENREEDKKIIKEEKEGNLSF